MGKITTLSSLRFTKNVSVTRPPFQCFALSFIMSPHPNDFNHFFVIMNLIDYPVLYIYSPGKGPG